MDLGKRDQKVKPGDSTAPETEDVESGEMTFKTVTSDCTKGPKGDDVEGGRRGNGPPQHVIDKFGGEHPRDAKGKPNK